MARFDYACPNCGVFEMDAGRDERQVEHACGMTATRRPFSGVPYLNGQTVAKSIPDPAYRQEAEHRQLKETWGGVDRTYEMLHRNTHMDEKTGMKQVDLKAMNAT